jgi:hypothetical protein
MTTVDAEKGGDYESLNSTEGVCRIKLDRLMPSAPRRLIVLRTAASILLPEVTDFTVRIVDGLQSTQGKLVTESN